MTWLLSLAANPILRALWRPVAALLGLLGFGYLQRRKGAQEAKADRAAETIKTMKTADEVQDEVAAKSDAAVRADLNRWVRPD